MTGVSLSISPSASKWNWRTNKKRNELAHFTRISTMRQLASPIAHELNQPLGAILRNAEAAELFLQNPSPDLDELRAIMADIRKDDHRAGDVIDRMRAIMKRRKAEPCRLDLNLLVSEVLPVIHSSKVRMALNPEFIAAVGAASARSCSKYCLIFCSMLWTP